MANYPNSVWSPSAKAAGNTIDASFFNDPQDEIVAIEDGIRNGTAPLNSSRSTVVALSVTAGSTFGARPVMPPPHIAVVYLDTVKDLGSSGASTAEWISQTILTNSSMHSTGTNPERLTPQSTGVYRVTCQVTFSVNSTGDRAIAIVDSSNVTIATAGAVAASTAATRIVATGYKRFDALGGHAQVTLGMTAATTLSMSTGPGFSFFAMEKL